ncbi:hypothetical protein QFC19_001798 [Naganishia cerealis]|uniref:Uncharacterized protein n=1 Tax=Naganishia cerealis TaxID=610337 RepID=A0ACC2WGD2_9TREE|nr:hypothetical protein QFC19_001798 [Naganishia cerealis]
MTSGEASDDEEKALFVAEPTVVIPKGRPKRGTTTTTAKVTTRTTASTTAARKGTRGTIKSASASALPVDSSGVGPEGNLVDVEVDDTGADELDALSRPTRTTTTSQSRAKGSKTPVTATAAITATTEDSVRPSTTTTTKKKPAATRKPTKRSAAPVKPEVAVSESEERVVVVDVAVKSETISAVPSVATTDASDAEMASSHLVVTASEPSDMEQEDDDDDDGAEEEERRRRRERSEYLHEEETVKSHRLQMVEVGAREAMAVMQNLGSKRLGTVRMLSRRESATPPAAAAAAATKQAAGNLHDRDNADDDDNNKQRVRSAIDDRGKDAGVGEVIELTAEEEQLTVVDYVRRMYARRREALYGAGEAKIRDWQEKADQARRFIESIPSRN